MILVVANLRDHRTDLELIFSMLGEAATTEIARKQDTKGLSENKGADRRRGQVKAGSGNRPRVSTPENYLFPLTAVGSAYATGPISYVTTNLLEQLGYITPNAFGGRTISPQVSELFSSALDIFKKSERAVFCLNFFGQLFVCDYLTNTITFLKILKDWFSRRSLNFATLLAFSHARIQGDQ